MTLLEDLWTFLIISHETATENLESTLEKTKT